MPGFSKQHYVEVAEILRWGFQDEKLTEGQMQYLVNSFSAMFAKDNPRFDRDRFKEAVWKETKYAADYAKKKKTKMPRSLANVGFPLMSK